MKNLLLTLTFLFSITSFAENSLKNNMVLMGQELKTISVKIAKGVIDDQAIKASENLKQAIIGAASFTPESIADQNLEENKLLKLLYSGLIFKLYGAAFELEYYLNIGDLTSAQLSLDEILDIRKQGHQFFKSPMN